MQPGAVTDRTLQRSTARWKTRKHAETTADAVAGISHPFPALGPLVFRGISSTEVD